MATQEFKPPLPQHLLRVLDTSRLCYLATVEGTEISAPTPHLSLMTYTFVDDAALGPVLVMTTRRDTLKFRAMTLNPNLALLVHDFNRDAGDAAGTLAITLYGRATLPEGAAEAALRAAHLARHPTARQFIADDYALLAFSPSLARMCNVRDEVSTWASTHSGAAAAAAAASAAAAPPAPAAAAPPLRVAVGSTNATKVRAVELAFACAFPTARLDVGCFAAPSGVPAQPMGDAETRSGALNRAGAAAAAAAAAGAGAPDYAVGLEGGCGDDPDGALVCFAWMAVLPAGGGVARASTARTATLRLPPAVSALVRGGMELGEADDAVFGRSGSKHKDGAVGLLTRGRIDRASYYAHALTLALAPFMSEELYR